MKPIKMIEKTITEAVQREGHYTAPNKQVYHLLANLIFRTGATDIVLDDVFCSLEAEVGSIHMDIKATAERDSSRGCWIYLDPMRQLTMPIYSKMYTGTCAKGPMFPRGKYRTGFGDEGIGVMDKSIEPYNPKASNVLNISYTESGDFYQYMRPNFNGEALMNRSWQGVAIMESSTAQNVLLMEDVLYIVLSPMKPELQYDLVFIDEDYDLEELKYVESISLREKYSKEIALLRKKVPCDFNKSLTEVRAHIVSVALEATTAPVKIDTLGSHSSFLAAIDATALLVPEHPEKYKVCLREELQDFLNDEHLDADSTISLAELLSNVNVHLQHEKDHEKTMARFIDEVLYMNMLVGRVFCD